MTAPTTGDTIVLIPGLLSDRTVWVPFVDAIGADGVVADLTTQDDLTDMAHDCLALSAGRMRVAGHSMGARVALEMARLAPDRIARLALLDTGVHPLAAGELPVREALVALARDHGMQALCDRWLPEMVHPGRHGDFGLMDALTAMVLRQTPESHARQIAALVNRPDARSYLGQIACPVLLMVGRQDAFSPVAQHEAMQALLPDARLVVIEEAGHFAPLERPEAVADALIPFLLG
ncbi:Pimeloyl-ACP methyl ester carboxylesterase [Loktanella fryxellensis]|uniref:Pimeloyl-ACP methyl ester carboxylesterase n=1 Tax=Loktanella fryxellensis TaxID=245187 RepID=A0A1H8HBS3_9RHOB|nr:alpha/beta hydrolase [Loktanella fryxellensis]SEN53701.1 Pimeloyl-ACP methyl ester carboxylesterase [Loktanella fryxellensis]